MRGGYGVAVPLVLVQSVFQSMHLNRLTPVTPPEIALDLALAHAVYGKDRLSADDQVGRVTTAVCLYGAMTYFASDVWTAPLAPIAGYLHYEYKNSKSTIAPIKPIVVGACWTAATYFQPLLIRHDASLFDDPGRAASLLLVMITVSHIADIDDIDNDRQAGVITPAPSPKLGADKSRTNSDTCPPD